MKNFKFIIALGAFAGMIAFSACSTSRKQTTEVKETPAPVAQAQLSAPVAPSQPTYTVANLGASTAGRAK